MRRKIRVRRRIMTAGWIGCRHSGRRQSRSEVYRDCAYGCSLIPTSPATITYNWNLQRDVGMTCGGEVTYLFEKIAPSSWRIVVFGAGHVAQKVARLLRMLDCRATFVDPRSDWVSKFPRVLILNMCVFLKRANMWDRSLEKRPRPDFALMTVRMLRTCRCSVRFGKKFPDAPYVGVIGSKVKGIKIERNESRALCRLPDPDALRVPMGLPFGKVMIG